MIGSFNPWKHYDNYSEQMFEDKSSDLLQWPIKLWQVPEVSPYFHHAHLLIAADCSAFACPTFRDKLSKARCLCFAVPLRILIFPRSWKRYSPSMRSPASP